MGLKHRINVTNILTMGDQLIEACYRGDLKTMRKMAPEFDLNVYRNESYTDHPSPLLAAILGQMMEYENTTLGPAKLMLEEGARPSAFDLYKTNQIVSMGELSYEFIPLLLSYGPDLNEKLRVNECGLDDHFLSDSESDTEEYGQSHQWTVTTPFKSSLYYGHMKTIKAYLNAGAILQPTEDFRAICHLSDGVELMELCVEKGANPLGAYNGVTHLESVCYNIMRFCPDSFKRIKWFMDHGARLDQRTTEEGPLMNYLLYQYYTRVNQVDAVKWFMENGARDTINWVDKYGDSPLSVAVVSNDERIVRVLLEYGADPHSGHALNKAKGEKYEKESLQHIRPHFSERGPISPRIIEMLEKLLVKK